MLYTSYLISVQRSTNNTLFLSYIVWITGFNENSFYNMTSYFYDKIEFIFI